MPSQPEHLVRGVQARVLAKDAKVWGEKQVRRQGGAAVRLERRAEKVNIDVENRSKNVGFKSIAMHMQSCAACHHNPNTPCAHTRDGRCLL